MGTNRIHSPYLRAYLVMLVFSAGLTLLLAGATPHPISAAPKVERTGASNPSQGATPDSHCAPDWADWPAYDLGAGRDQLLEVAAVSPVEAWAVGMQIESPYRPLIARWNGGIWAGLTGIPHLEAGGALWDVAAIAADDVWAVGYYDAGNRRWRTLALHWDGTAWTQVPTPSPGTGSSYLLGVTALSANDVWAVGASCCVDYDTQTLTMRWDGSAWQVVPSPNIKGMNNTFYAVDAVSPNDAWAVGAYGAYDNRQTMIAHWDGSRWSQAGTSMQGALNGIAAISATDAWAVGYSGPSTSRRSLIIRYDGTGWQVAPSPSPGSIDNVLHDVAAVSGDDVWAVGSFRNYDYYGEGPNETLIVHWDGGRWLAVPSPNRGWGSNAFYGIAVASPSEMWAVGQSGDYYMESFVARYAARLTFDDVWLNEYYYEPVLHLYCMDAISGYADNTFRPYNYTTRAQLAKILVLAEGWAVDTAGGPHFNDVPPNDPFYGYIETMYNRSIIAGYGCGGAGEPCPGLYFRPGSNITRAQVPAKVTVLAEGWSLANPLTPTFADVPSSSPFYQFVETAVAHDIIAGYACGSPEPCDPQRRPYFRPNNPAIRGQIAKIVYNAVTAP